MDLDPKPADMCERTLLCDMFYYDPRAHCACTVQLRSLEINYTSVVVNIHSNNSCSLVPWSLFSFVRERKESQKIREGPGDEATTSVSLAVVWEDGRVCNVIMKRLMCRGSLSYKLQCGY